MATSYSPKVLSNGLVFYVDAANRKSYSTSSSTNWNDLTYGQKTGSLKGGTVYTGSNLGTMVFNGSSTYVAIDKPSNGALDFGTGNFSTGMWVNFSALGDGTTGFLTGDNYSGASTYNGWAFNIYNAAGGLGIATRNAVNWAGPDTHCRYATANFSTNTWYHIFGTRISNVLRLYVNATQRATATESSATNVTNSSEMRIGSLSAGSPQYFNGKIALVQIYNVGLSASEVLTNYNANKQRFGV